MKRDAWALCFAMVFPAVMTWVYFVAAAGEGTQRNTAVMVAYVAGKLVQFGFPALYVGLTDRRSLMPGWPNCWGLVVGAVFGFVVGAAALALYFGILKDTTYLQDAPDKVLAKLRGFGLDSASGFVALAAFYSILHAFLEEYYWRWFVFGWLKRLVRVWPAVLLASLAFAAHHVVVLAVYFPGLGQFFTLVVPLSLGIAVGGAVWCGIYQRTQSLGATWISHMLIDAAIMVIGYDMIADKLGQTPGGTP